MATSTHIRIVLKPHLFIYFKQESAFRSYVHIQQIFPAFKTIAHVRKSKKSWILDSTPLIPDSGTYTGFRIICQQNLDYGFQSQRDSEFFELYSRFQSPGFQISWLKVQPIRIRLDGSHIPVRISILHLRFAVFVPVTVSNQRCDIFPHFIYLLSSFKGNVVIGISL